MTNLTIFLADLAGLSTNQFVKLTPSEKLEADRYLDKLSTAVKLARAKFDAALLQCYGERAKAALLESGRDFGTAHITDGPLRMKLATQLLYPMRLDSRTVPCRCPGAASLVASRGCGGG